MTVDHKKVAVDGRADLKFGDAVLDLPRLEDVAGAGHDHIVHRGVGHLDHPRGDGQILPVAARFGQRVLRPGVIQLGVIFVIHRDDDRAANLLAAAQDHRFDPQRRARTESFGVRRNQRLRAGDKGNRPRRRHAGIFHLIGALLLKEIACGDVLVVGRGEDDIGRCIGSPGEDGGQFVGVDFEEREELVHVVVNLRRPQHHIGAPSLCVAVTKGAQRQRGFGIGEGRHHHGNFGAFGLLVN